MGTLGGGATTGAGTAAGGAGTGGGAGGGVSAAHESAPADARIAAAKRTVDRALSMGRSLLPARGRDESDPAAQGPDGPPPLARLPPPVLSYPPAMSVDDPEPLTPA